jgi:hypothetical protein
MATFEAGRVRAKNRPIGLKSNSRPPAALYHHSNAFHQTVQPWTMRTRTIQPRQSEKASGVDNGVLGFLVAPAVRVGSKRFLMRQP